MKKDLIEKFLNTPHKKISLMGMSGVGKTHLSKKLPKNDWFHYSVDYRIGDRHLSEEIHDFLTTEAMQQPALAKLIKEGAISVKSQLTVDNLAPLSAYLGMMGSESKGGVNLDVFLERLEKHRLAEINAIKDIPYFMDKARNILGFSNFIIDTSGSFCEIQDEASWALIGTNSLLVYIKASKAAKDYVIERAQTHPKPLYYQQDFLLPQIEIYLEAQGLTASNEITPSDFTRWIFPRLIEHRLGLYEMIAEKYGVTIDAEKLYHVKDQDDFFELIKEAAYA